MSNKKQVFHRRLFLNDSKGMAALEAEISNHSWEQDGERHVSIEGNFTVSDCYRQISLDLCFDDEESLGKVVRKLNRLIHAAEDVRDALVKEAHREGIKRK